MPLVNNIKDFFQNHPTVTKFLVVSVLMVSAFSVGRYTVPTKIVTKTEIQTVHDIVTKVETQVVEKKVYIVAQHDNVMTTTDTIKSPDGTVETKTVIVDKTETASANTDESSSQAVVAVAEHDKTDTQILKIQDSSKSQWHLRVDAGVGMRFVSQKTPVLVLGVGAERRVIGPFFMGLWAQTTLNLLIPSAPPYQVAGGLSLGIEL